MNFLEASNDAAHQVKLKQLYMTNLNVYSTGNRREDSKGKWLNRLDNLQLWHTATCV
jgi:hypothetical protein